MAFFLPKLILYTDEVYKAIFCIHMVIMFCLCMSVCNLFVFLLLSQPESVSAYFCLSSCMSTWLYVCLPLVGWLANVAHTSKLFTLCRVWVESVRGEVE